MNFSASFTPRNYDHLKESIFSLFSTISSVVPRLISISWSDWFQFNLFSMSCRFLDYCWIQIKVVVVAIFFLKYWSHHKENCCKYIIMFISVTINLLVFCSSTRYYANSQLAVSSTYVQYLFFVQFKNSKVNFIFNNNRANTNIYKTSAQNFL